MFPILIVDDSREDLILAERVLESCKILNPIVKMTSGAECIAFLKNGLRDAAWDAQGGALLFLDLSMTPVSGLEVLRSGFETEIGEKSIFVMLSGISDIKLLREGYQLGAKTFLIKPLKPADVLEFLSTVKDRIGIEESPDGYTLHWTGAKKNHTNAKKKTNPVLSIPA